MIVIEDWEYKFLLGSVFSVTFHGLDDGIKHHHCRFNCTIPNLYIRNPWKSQCPSIQNMVVSPIFIIPGSQIDHWNNSPLESFNCKSLLQIVFFSKRSLNSSPLELQGSCFCGVFGGFVSSSFRGNGFGLRALCQWDGRKTQSEIWRATFTKKNNRVDFPLPHSGSDRIVS